MKPRCLLIHLISKLVVSITIIQADVSYTVKILKSMEHVMNLLLHKRRKKKKTEMLKNTGIIRVNDMKAHLRPSSSLKNDQFI